ncbi:hypothetical protein EYF80_018613 [Liparis tanakae]|uniref:Uncharacterized protein n=1 Tax=Liparis tanakae TaxID=230148 RepID=A0A4Z2I1I6_9TELE|nr:hypothetical protein EYF80_018613 [Liparis tanakae]
MKKDGKEKIEGLAGRNMEAGEERVEERQRDAERVERGSDRGPRVAGEESMRRCRGEGCGPAERELADYPEEELA